MLNVLLSLIGSLVILPACALLVLTVAAIRRQRDPMPLPSHSSPSIRLTVLVPAHNESTHLLPTLVSIQAQLGKNDRLVVVADNCTDDTAAVALSTGAEVIERHETQLRGKGYALAYGVEHLRPNPPDVVAIVDADCILSDMALSAMRLDCHRSGKPVQILNLMTTASTGSSLRFRIMEFAMLMKNKVRPMGSWSLGQTCHLMGTGMALPWALISQSNLATGHIAEDMKLGIDLTLKGFPPRFLEIVQINSQFVEDSLISKAQKSRWEHGHLAVMAEELPHLLWAALKQRNRALFVLAMDLVIPPVAFYFLVLTVLLVGSWAAMGLTQEFQTLTGIATIGYVAFTLSILIGWWSHGRHLLSPRELLLTPVYALWKLPVYIAFFIRKRSAWTRTQRSKE